MKATEEGSQCAVGNDLKISEAKNEYHSENLHIALTRMIVSIEGHSEKYPDTAANLRLKTNLEDRLDFSDSSSESLSACLAFSNLLARFISMSLPSSSSSEV